MEDLWKTDNNAGPSSKTIADMLVETANECISNVLLPGFAYSAEHDLWYNNETQYWYDMKTSLYYHQSTGWLQYNVLKGEYESCEPKSKYKEKWKTKKLRLSAIRRFGNEYVKSMDQEAIDVCTLLFDLINRVVFLSGDESQSRKFAELGQFDEELQDYVRYKESTADFSNSDDEDLTDEQRRRAAEEESSLHPSCIRLIDRTDFNKLSVVTIAGAKIGCSDKCDIFLRLTDSVADEHVQIIFIDDDKDQHYRIECLQKKHCAYLNGQKVSAKKSARLEHGNQLVIGPYEFDVHIHSGNNTCINCEPGILNAKLREENESRQRMSANERRSSHRQELRSIKKQLGFNEFELDEMHSSPVKYKDRAKKRRQTQGSEPNYPDNSDIHVGCKATPQPGASADSVQLQSQKTTVSAGLNSENKGFKMLKMMGWSEGTGLGSEKQGIVSAIEPQLKTDKQGLGAVNQTQQPQISVKEKRRLEIIEKTRRRFDEAGPQHDT